MPKCIECPKLQSKLSCGNLCKSCFMKKGSIIVMDEYIDDNDQSNFETSFLTNYTSPSERDIVDVIKDMLKEKQQQHYYIELN